MNSVENFRSLVNQRLAEYPDNGYYLAGRDQLAIIDRELDGTGHLSKAIYASLTLGVMCAREVEQIDMPFCDAAYEMLGNVKPIG